MRRMALVFLFACCGFLTGAGVTEGDWREVRLIRSLPLKKVDKTIADPPGYSGTVAFFLDEKGRCRKAVVRHAGDNTECCSTGYYDAHGRLVLSVYNERRMGAQEYVFYGVTRFKDGKPVRHDTWLGEKDGRPGPYKSGIPPVIAGYRGGTGRLLRLFPAASGLLRHFRYPAGFADRGQCRYGLPTEPRPAQSLGQGIPVRATPDNTGTVVGVLEAGTGLTVMNALTKPVPGQAAEPWVFVCYSDRERGTAGYEGWVPGIYVEMDEE